MLALYHRTTAQAAEAILENGFRDGTWHGITGVFVSNVPLDVNEGAKGPILLLIEARLTEAELAEFEIIEEGKPYREWIVPAALLNGRATITRDWRQ